MDVNNDYEIFSVFLHLEVSATVTNSGRRICHAAIMSRNSVSVQTSIRALCNCLIV
jgi:hypothetical protein